MEVFLTIRRQRTTILLDFKENTTVLDVKNTLVGITKVPAENIKLWNDPFGKVSLNLVALFVLITPCVFTN